MNRKRINGKGHHDKDDGDWDDRKKDGRKE